LKDEELKIFGEELFTHIFCTPERRAHLKEWLREANEGGFLCIKITSPVAEVHNIPFEIIYSPETGFFLRHKNISIVRDIPGLSKTVLPDKKERLNMLVIVSLPQETYERNPLNPLEELEVIYNGLKEEIASGIIEIDVEERANMKAIRERLSTRRYDIIHFTGHGTAGGGILIEDEEDPRREKILDREEFARQFALEGVRFFYFNACSTGRSLTFNPSMAFQVYRQMPQALVLANITTVYDHTATEVAGRFYDAFLKTPVPAKAVQEARMPLGRDWWKPVLFAPSPDREVFTLPEERKKGESKRIFNIPAETISPYVYRYSLVREVSEVMARGENHIALVGMGGCGKSTLARYIARFFAGRFRNIMFFDLTREDTPEKVVERISAEALRAGLVTAKEYKKLKGDLGQLPQPLNIEMTIDEVFRKVEGKTFVVLDNLEGTAQDERGILRSEWDALLEALLRQNAFVLLTSRVLPYRGDRRNPLIALPIHGYSDTEFNFL
ncbi:MAG: CHAT domain-containing protein, partial [Nitrospirae bacterium]